jgi:hypothetical protein
MKTRLRSNGHWFGSLYGSLSFGNSRSGATAPRIRDFRLAVDGQNLACHRVFRKLIRASLKAEACSATAKCPPPGMTMILDLGIQRWAVSAAIR